MSKSIYKNYIFGLCSITFLLLLLSSGHAFAEKIGKLQSSQVDVQGNQMLVASCTTNGPWAYCCKSTDNKYMWASSSTPPPSLERGGSCSFLQAGGSGPSARWSGDVGCSDENAKTVAKSYLDRVSVDAYCGG